MGNRLLNMAIMGAIGAIVGVCFGNSVERIVALIVAGLVVGAFSRVIH